MGDNIFNEPQPEPHLETRVKFVVQGSTLMLCGEGWIQPREPGQFKDVTCIKIDRPTLHESTEHGVENETLTDEELNFWLDNFLIAKEESELFACCLEDEFQVLK